MNEAYRTSVPNEELIQVAVKTLANLPVQTKPYRGASGNADTRCGRLCSISNLIDDINEYLAADHSENIHELDKNVAHEYIVEITNADSLYIWTRLYSKDGMKEGSIFYGVEIIKVDQDEYLLWQE